VIIHVMYVIRWLNVQQRTQMLVYTYLPAIPPGPCTVIIHVMYVIRWLNGQQRTQMLV